MKVLLLKDVYKLGRAGDVKKVANGYGRNFLIPQGLAVLATAGALKQVVSIQNQASLQRAQLNDEMSSVAEVLNGQYLMFAARAGETGKLYGSVTTRMIADAIQAKFGIEVDTRQIDTQPLRMLGEHEVNIRLTMDLIPTVKAFVHREGEAAELPGKEAAEEATEEEAAEAEVEVEVEAAEEPAEEAAPEVEEEA